MSVANQSRIIWFLLTLLAGATGFGAKMVVSHEQRITTIEERVPQDLKERLTRIEDGINRITPADGTTYKSPNTHSR